MNRVTWLITYAIWTSFSVVFVIFFGLELVFRILDEAKRSQVGYTFNEIALVTISGMPRRLYLDLPLIVLISVAVGLGGLARSSELTILRVSGLSILRIVQKTILALLPIIVGCLFVAEFGMPQAEQFSQKLQDQNVKAGVRDSVWTRESGRFVFIKGEPDGSVQQWRQITMRHDRPEIERLTLAEKILFSENNVELVDAKTLRFRDAVIKKVEGSISQVTKLSDIQIRWLIQAPDTLAISELWEASSYLASEGLNARIHSQLFWQRALLPFVLIALALVASATAFGSTRAISMSTRVFGAVFVGLIFKYSMDMASPAVFLAGGHPSLSIILPLLVPIALTRLFLR